MAADPGAPIIDGIDDLVEVGRGGFAVVYRGHQTAFRRDVAVKVMSSTGLDTDDRGRFERECQAMGLLSDHPGIVTLYDAGFTTDGRPYMVMAFVGGGSLGERIARQAMAPNDVAQLGVRLCGALETAHRASVLHRDIKPANVLCSDYGEQLSDFGIARIAGGHETKSGVITASLAHAAPEILDGSRPSVAADVYSLGSTLFEAAVGRAAFVRDTDESLLPLIRRVVSDPVPDMTGFGVPAPLARAIETAMAKQPVDRYESAGDFGRALQEAQRAMGAPITELAIVGPPASGPEATVVVEPPAPADPDPTPPGPPATPDAAPPPPPTGPAPSTPPSPSTPKRSRRLVLALVGAAVVAAGIGAAFVLTNDDGDGGETQSAPDALSTSTTAATTTSEETPGATVAAGDFSEGPAILMSSGQFRGTLEPLVNQTVGELNLSRMPQVQTAPFDDMTDLLRAASDAGASPIIVFGDAASMAVEQVAGASSSSFVVIGGSASGANILNVDFATNESSYVTGIAAARATQSGRVAFIGGIDATRTNAAEAGFVAGVRSVDPAIQIDVRYLGPESLSAQEARSVAEAAIGLGADVLFHAAGAAGVGVIDAAVTAGGVWTIGAEADWHAETEGARSSFVLTSAVDHHDVGLRAAFEALEATDYNVSAIAPIRLGFAEKGVSYSTGGGFLADIVDELDQAVEAIEGGRLSPPSLVELRAVAPRTTSCPSAGCIIGILQLRNVGGELEAVVEANWIMRIEDIHAHWFWWPNYSAEQVGLDSADRFGVPVGDWDVDARYPIYTTENAAAAGLRGNATHLCVTAADADHNVINPALVSCAPIAGLF